jgi:hypothetical protein
MTGGFDRVTLDSFGSGCDSSHEIYQMHHCNLPNCKSDSKMAGDFSVREHIISVHFEQYSNLLETQENLKRAKEWSSDWMSSWDKSYSSMNTSRSTSSMDSSMDSELQSSENLLVVENQIPKICKVCPKPVRRLSRSAENLTALLTV